jgi:hypothetical protein
MRTVFLLLIGALLLAQDPQPPIEAGEVSGVRLDAAFVQTTATIKWTAQQFKDYCGRTTDGCVPPEFVTVVDDNDPYIAKLEARIKALEETVQNDHWDITILQQKVEALEAKAAQ